MKLSVCLLAMLLAAGYLLPQPALGQSSGRVEAENLFVEAQKALSRGDTDGAESLLRETLAKDPGFTSAIWQLAQIYERQGKLDYARELYKRGLSQDPQAEWARDKLARIESTVSKRLVTEAREYIDSGDISRAMPLLATYLGSKPNDSQALLMMGTCHLAKGNVQAARDCFRKVLANDPGNREAAASIAKIEKREREARLEKLVAAAQVILLRLTVANSDSARSALEAVRAADTANVWARDQLMEVDRFLAAEQRKTEKRAPARETAQVVVEKSREALGDTKSALARSSAFILKRIGLVVLAAVLVMLGFDLRRRMNRRSYPLEGTMTLIPILDIVSLINANLRSGRLIVVSSEAKGEIYFEKGEIIHARCGGVDGKKAFHALMELGSGRYFFHNHLPRVRRSITEPLSLLLLSMRPCEESTVDLEHEIKPEPSLTRTR